MYGPLKKKIYIYVSSAHIYIYYMHVWSEEYTFASCMDSGVHIFRWVGKKTPDIGDKLIPPFNGEVLKWVYKLLFWGWWPFPNKEGNTRDFGGP